MYQKKYELQVMYNLNICIYIYMWTYTTDYPIYNPFDSKNIGNCARCLQLYLDLLAICSCKMLMVHCSKAFVAHPWKPAWVTLAHLWKPAGVILAHPWKPWMFLVHPWKPVPVFLVHPGTYFEANHLHEEWNGYMQTRSNVCRLLVHLRHMPLSPIS